MPMRQLRTCDFCGDDAAGLYEVVPPELDPTEDEQRRVVLCGDCQKTLESVVSPLLARLGAATGTEAEAGAAVSPDADPERSGSPEPVPASVDAGARDSVERGDRPLSEPAEPAEEREPDSETEMPEHATTADANSRVDESDPADGEAAADGAGTDASDDADDDEPVDEERPSADYEVDDARQHETATEDPAEDYEVVEETEESAGSDDVGPDVDTGNSEESVESVESAESSESEPPQFRKVMRLLNNREFPIDRAEFTDLASGAYDIDRSQADDIVDHAIRRGVLEEESGQLRKA